MGSDAFSVPVFSALLQDGASRATPLEVVGVVTQPDRPAGRGRKPAASPVKGLALERGVQVAQPERVRRPEGMQEILSFRPDLIVVASFGQILPASLLDAPRFSCLNLHPSLLPRYRGPSPIAGPILAGDELTGTSLMLMTPPMDAGPILAQVTTPIGREETAGDLGMRLADMSGRLLLEELPQWIEGRMEPIPQDESLATYTRLVRKEDGWLRWEEPAVRLARLVRAFNPWPGAFTEWEGRRLLMHRARAEEGSAEPGLVVDVLDGAITIGTGDGMLAVTEVQLAGGKRLNAEQFVRGHPGVVGARLARPGGGGQ